MPTVDLRAINTEAFVFARLLTVEALAYPLETGVIRAQMRTRPDSALVFYEWSTTNGRVALTPSLAVGSLILPTNPAPGTTLTIGGATVTFVAGAATGLQVTIAADHVATVAALAVRLSGSAHPDLAALTFTATGDRLDIVAGQAGPIANAVPLATTVEGAVLSGATLEGGGTLLTLIAPQSDIGRFLGDYVYDVRFEDEAGVPIAVLFGGALVFTQGVTRN